MTKLREQAEARRLRALGWSLRKIAVELDVSLASASVWVRDVEVPAPPPTPPEYVTESLEELRRCAKCEQLLPMSSFNRYRDGHQWWCRECFREYFRARGKRHRDQVHEARRKRRVPARALVEEHLASHPCVDCGEDNPAVLEFDHVGSKRGNVSTMSWDGFSVAALEQEIAGCDVVCANCHRRRTAHRNNSWRVRPIQRDVPPHEYGRIRNRELVRESLLATGCVDCGTMDLLVLEFDHFGVKTANVSQLVRDAVSVERLKGEISRCAVRCANCHKKRTAERRRA